MSGVINIKEIGNEPVFEFAQGLTPEQLSRLDKQYLKKRDISTRLYETLRRAGWEESDIGIHVGALLEVTLGELVNSTRQPRWGTRYGLGPKGLGELQTAL